MGVKNTIVRFRHDDGYGDDLLNHINAAIKGKDMFAECTIEPNDLDVKSKQRLRGADIATTATAPLHAATLLPCPFCGGRAEPCYLGDWRVECIGCGAVSYPDGTRYEKNLAIKDWNTRIINGVKAVFSHEMLGKLGPVWIARSGKEMYGPCKTLDEFDEV